MAGTELLFSYGTLQLEPIQLAIIGRTVTGQPDVLPGFEQTFVEIDDKSVQSLTGKSRHVIVKFTGRPSDTIPGTVLALTPEEMQKADGYETAEYLRVSVLLQSGTRAWVYVDARYQPPGA
jgi:Gamma-glutamyl cyclotransferase, AIG2-like